MKYLKTFEGNESDYKIYLKIKQELEDIKFILEDDNIEFDIRYNFNSIILCIIGLKNKNITPIEWMSDSGSNMENRESYNEWKNRLYEIIEEQYGLRVYMNTVDVFLIEKK